MPFFTRFVKGGPRHLEHIFSADRPIEGEDGIKAHWAYQHAERLELDNFEVGDNPASNTLGGGVTTSGGFLTFDEFEFKPFGADRYLNLVYQHFSHALVLEWDTPQFMVSTIPPARRNVSAYKALSFRVSQIIGSAVPNRNPLHTPRTIRVALVNSANAVANDGFDTVAVQSVPYPYEYNGGKSVLTTVRIPLSAFKLGQAAFPLDDVAAVRMEFDGTGLIAIDDIQFTK